MTAPNVNPALPYPLLGGSQWRTGMAINDVKLHQKIDGPLEQMGGVARTWGQSLASFSGAHDGTAIVGSATWATQLIGMTTVTVDTQNGWDPAASAYTPPTSGLYLLSACICQSTSVAFQLLMGDRFQENAMNPFESPVSEPIANGGCQLSVIVPGTPQMSFGIQITASATGLAGGCFFMIQQLGWSG